MRLGRFFLYFVGQMRKSIVFSQEKQPKAGQESCVLDKM